MPPSIHGRLSTLCILAACLIVLFLTNTFTNQDVSVNTQAKYQDRAAAPAAVVKREVEAPVTIVAVPFGDKAGLQLGPPQGGFVLRSIHLKRAGITWSAAITAGNTQLARLNGGDRVDSLNTELSDMVGSGPDDQGNGWTVSELTDEPDVPEGYTEVYQELGISDGTANHYRYSLQDQTFGNCFEDDLSPTKGRFRDMINIQSGVIVALSSYSPAYLIDKSDPNWKSKLPRVSRMSDVLWIQWADVAQKEGDPDKVSQLKYIFRYDVITPDTKFIIEQAAAKKEDDTIGEGEFEAEWPGHEFTTGSDQDQFVALLGTVHGISIVDLIMTHATDLPGKSIESVNIFTTEGDVDNGEVYHMLWTLSG